MITKKSYEQSRTPTQLSTYVSDIFTTIMADKQLRTIARRRTGYYKEFISELYPLSIYCNWKYNSSNVLCKVKIGNQGYDAEIINRDTSELIERIEITNPINGNEHANIVRNLNEDGRSSILIGEQIAEQFRSVVVHLMESVIKKSMIDYKSEKESSLLIAISTEYLPMNQAKRNSEITSLIKELGNIPFRFIDNVYLITTMEIGIYPIKLTQQT